MGSSKRNRKLPASHWAVRAEKLFRHSVQEDIEEHRKAGRITGKAGAVISTKSVPGSVLSQAPKPNKSRKPSKRR